MVMLHMSSSFVLVKFQVLYPGQGLVTLCVLNRFVLLCCSCVFLFYLLTKASVFWGEETSFGKISPSDRQVREAFLLIDG